MANYYKHGNTVYKLDIEKNTVVSVTNSEYSRAIAISDNAPQAASIMNHHFSASLDKSQRGDYPIVLSNEEEFLDAKAAFNQYIVSHSLDI